MPKKQLTEAEIIKAKIAARTTVITTIITVAGTLLGIVITVIWGPMLLQKWTSTPASTIEPTPLSRDWYVIFELKFPSNYWAEGTHSYLFDANCPFGINSTEANEPSYSFTVDQTALIQNSTVYIRRRGLYLNEIEGNSFGNSVHPSQETAAIYSPFAITFEDAKRLQDECKVSIKIDNEVFMDLTPIKIDKTQ